MNRPVTMFFSRTAAALFFVLVFTTVTTALFFGTPGRECRSNRDCGGFGRTSCEGRGPNFLFIFPTCGRQRPYSVSGRCDTVPDVGCRLGNLFGRRNSCNDGSRCAECLRDSDCSGYRQECSGGHCRRRNDDTTRGR